MIDNAEHRERFFRRAEESPLFSFLNSALFACLDVNRSLESTSHPETGVIETMTDVVQPRAYALALKQREGVTRNYESLKRELGSIDCSARLRDFIAFVQNGYPAINMSVANCVRFLDGREWLNIYEATAKTTGARGKLLEMKVRKRIRIWYIRRRTIELLLQFRRNTHYAALNLGGPGTTRYGACCVLLSTSTANRHSTCFAGDTLRAVFDSSGQRVLSDDEVLSRFSVREDAHLLAAIRHAHLFRNSRPGVVPAEVRGLLEDSDSVSDLRQSRRLVNCEPLKAD